MFVLSCFVFFKGPHSRLPGISRDYSEMPAAPFSALFFFQAIKAQKVSKWEPQIDVKSLKSAKTRHQNALASKSYKKTPPGRGQTLKKADSITVLAVFSDVQGSQKGVKKVPKMESLGTQNHKKTKKKSTRKNIKKHTAKSASQAPFGGGPGGVLGFQFFVIFRHGTHFGLKMAPGPSQDAPGRPK